MSELKAIGDACGFANVRTFIASGNLLFESGLPEAGIKALIEAKLKTYADKPVDVLVRTAKEMADVLAGNPFPDAAPNRTVVIFLDEAPPTDTIMQCSGINGEELRMGLREIYVHYGDGMADSKLKIPAAKTGTARNMNTVKNLAALLGETPQ